MTGEGECEACHAAVVDTERKRGPKQVVFAIIDKHHSLLAAKDAEIADLKAELESVRAFVVGWANSKGTCVCRHCGKYVMETRRALSGGKP